MSEPKTVVVTGGAGFIGSALCRWLIEETDTNVHVIDLLTYAGDRSTLATIADSDRLSFHQADIRDREAMLKAVQEMAPDAIFHLAAESHVDNSISGPGAFIETNVNGTYSLLEAARAYRDGLPAERADSFRFVHVSTDEVFGSLGPSGSFTESTPYDPSSPYSASKAASDHLARAWFRTYGLPTIITNCSNNYGPYQFPEKLIPVMILKAIGGEPLPVYGDGANVRDWLFVEDHCRGLWAAATKGKPGDSYNFGGSAERTNLEVVEAICDTVDELNPLAGNRRSLISFVPDRPGHDFRYAMDSSYAAAALGWYPSVEFEPGLRSTVEWYIAHSDWCVRMMKRNASKGSAR